MSSMMLSFGRGRVNKLNLLGAVLVAVLGAGCAGPTKINIPPLQGDVAWHDANARTVVRIEAVSLDRIIRDFPTEGAFAVKLPDGTSDESYETVLIGVGRGAVRADETNQGLPNYEAAQIQIKGTVADVDIIRPLQGGARQLVRAEMALDMDGWYVRRVRPWDIDVVEQLRIIRGGLEPVRVRPAETMPGGGEGGGVLEADDAP